MSVGVSILGSTGSIGQTTLQVIRHLGDGYHVAGLAAGTRLEVLEEQIREFRPRLVSVATEQGAKRLREIFPDMTVLHGEEGAVAVAEMDAAHTVVAAIVGAKGLAPTYSAVLKGKRVALANKESLVMAGRFVMDAAHRTGAELLPVDSEHCAIFQCLKGERVGQVLRILLTASGGALRDWDPDRIEGATVEEVLRHPTWSMGPKITVDSATMMNKGLEVIEAHYLFAIPLSKIDVLLHPQSIVHSMVEFADGSVMAQLATTDMALPVQYALTYPARLPGCLKRLSLADSPPLTFLKADPDRFPCLTAAREAAETSEAHVIALNAANEEAVQAFLDGLIPFGAIARILRTVLDRIDASRPVSFEEIPAMDAEARRLTRTELEKIRA